MSLYVDLLIQEIEASQRLDSRPLTSVFFGGGACRRRLQMKDAQSHALKVE